MQWRRPAIVALVLALSAVAAVADEPAPPGAAIRVAVGSVALRTEPTPDASVIRRLSIGQVVELVSTSEGAPTSGGHRRLWYQIRTPESVVGWVAASLTMLLPGTPAHDLIPSDHYPREVDDSVSLDLSAVDRAQAAADFRVLEDAWSALEPCNTVSLLRAERQLLTRATGIWLRDSPEEPFEAFVGAIGDASMLAALLPPTVSGGILPGNGLLWAYSNVQTAAFLATSADDPPWRIIDETTADGGLIVLIPPAGMVDHPQGVALVVMRVSSALYPRSDGRYEVSGLYFFSLDGANSPYELESVSTSPGMQLRSAIYGSAGHLTIDTGV